MATRPKARPIADPAALPKVQYPFHSFFPPYSIGTPAVQPKSNPAVDWSVVPLDPKAQVPQVPPPTGVMLEKFPRQLKPFEPPSGHIMAVATCCPGVATFEGSTGARNTYFGFDDKTNLVANENNDEYWVPPTAKKKLPGNKETRDGARWASVGIGLETQVEINFGPAFTKGCLVNCTYQVEPQNIAEVSSPIPTSSGAAFKIKGISAGEASLKVMCNGELIGYFHIWCAKMAKLLVDIGTIVTTKTTAARYSSANLETVLNEIFRQALIDFTVNDLGQIDLSGDKKFIPMENRGYLPDLFWPLDDFKAGLNARVQAKLASDAIAKNRIYEASPYQVFYYVPSSVPPKAGGSVLNIGESPAFCWHDSNPFLSYLSIAHELGHSLGLRHPNDLPYVTGQLAQHLLDSEFQPVRTIWATNTEETSTRRSAQKNVMAEDPYNLMGYGHGDHPTIRYGQWKICRGNI